MGNMFWNVISLFLKIPREELEAPVKLKEVCSLLGITGR
jgi:hypothetical protein